MVDFSSALLPVHSEIHDEASVRGKLNPLLRLDFDEMFDPIIRSSDLPKLDDFSVVVVPVLTGGTEHLILRIAEMSRSIILLAFSTNNSLAACLEAYPEISKMTRAEIVLEDPDLPNLNRALRGVRRFLKGEIISVGGPSKWLIHNRVDRSLLTKKLGLRIGVIPMEEFSRILSEIGDEEALKEIPEWEIGEEVDSKDLLEAGRVCAALRRISAGRPITIRCFDLLPRTGCLALCRLLDEGIPAACEGDIPSLLTMHLLMSISGKPAWMANISDLRRELFLAHCTVPSRITDHVRLTTHFESGGGVGIEGKILRSEVTLAKILPSLNEIVLGKCRVLRSGRISEGHCRTQVLTDLRVDPDYLARLGVGSHLVIVMGDLTKEVKLVAFLLGMKVRPLTQT